MTKTEKNVLKFGVPIILFLVIGIPVISYLSGDDKDFGFKLKKEISIENADEVLQAIQGKWQGRKFNSNANFTQHYRFEIIGNQMTVYTKLGDNTAWDMSNIRSVHSIRVAPISMTQAGNKRRFIFVDDPSLAVRVFEPLEVMAGVFTAGDRGLRHRWD
ncbi:hypothetical protein FNJ87_01575 [Nonlabens mediterrranea]|uniref:DUF1579 domain-containing protein n=1 Tax=Nonlabens mediterrranea TaxID=1419947 RepID=A0ABS0A158_9FLAO|nr:hypothetical protein [Nonlabens mediterrranea]